MPVTAVIKDKETFQPTPRLCYCMIGLTNKTDLWLTENICKFWKKVNK